MNDISWSYKALIGASGGLCLSLLKLIDADFYLDDLSSKQAIVGYLTYLSFIIIGVFVAIFLCEHDAPKEKTIRSAFVLGLLGPSILIAILKQPVVIEEPPKGLLQDINRVGYLLMSPAYAQPPDVSDTATGTPSTSGAVKVLKKEDLEPTYKQAFWMAIGRSVPAKDHVYVVGVAENAAKAVETAGNINRTSSVATRGLTAQVLKVEGKDEYYITVGDLETSKAALETKTSAQAAAIDTLTGTPDRTSKRAATLLLEGKVISGESLLVGLTSSGHTAIASRPGSPRINVEKNEILETKISARTEPPVILSARVDSSEHTVVISGHYFGTVLPTVKLGDRVMNVESFSPNQVIVTLPPDIPPATYSLTVTANRPSPSTSDTFSAALFATADGQQVPEEQTSGVPDR